MKKLLSMPFIILLLYACEKRPAYYGVWYNEERAKRGIPLLCSAWTCNAGKGQRRYYESYTNPKRKEKDRKHKAYHSSKSILYDNKYVLVSEYDVYIGPKKYYVPNDYRIDDISLSIEYIYQVDTPYYQGDDTGLYCSFRTCPRIIPYRFRDSYYYDHGDYSISLAEADSILESWGISRNSCD